MNKKILSRLWVYFSVVVVVGLLIFPIYWMVNTSLAPSDHLYEFSTGLLPGQPPLESFRKVLFERPMLEWLSNSFKIALVATLLSMVVSVLAAYSLSRYRAPGSSAMGIFILSSRALPSTMRDHPIIHLLQAVGADG